MQAQRIINTNVHSATTDLLSSSQTKQTEKYKLSRIPNKQIEWLASQNNYDDMFRIFIQLCI